MTPETATGANVLYSRGRTASERSDDPAIAEVEVDHVLAMTSTTFIENLVDAIELALIGGPGLAEPTLS